MAAIVPPVPAWGLGIFGVQPVTDDFKAYVLLLIKSMDIVCPNFAAGWSKGRLAVLPVQDIKALFESVDADDWLDTFDMPGFNGGRQRRVVLFFRLDINLFPVRKPVIATDAGASKADEVGNTLDISTTAVVNNARRGAVSIVNTQMSLLSGIDKDVIDRISIVGKHNINGTNAPVTTAEANKKTINTLAQITKEIRVAEGDQNADLRHKLSELSKSIHNMFNRRNRLLIDIPNLLGVVNQNYFRYDHYARSVAAAIDLFNATEGMQSDLPTPAFCTDAHSVLYDLFQQIYFYAIYNNYVMTKKIFKSSFETTCPDEVAKYVMSNKKHIFYCTFHKHMTNHPGEFCHMNPASDQYKKYSKRNGSKDGYHGGGGSGGGSKRRSPARKGGKNRGDTNDATKKQKS